MGIEKHDLRMYMFMPKLSSNSNMSFAERYKLTWRKDNVLYVHDFSHSPMPHSPSAHFFIPSSPKMILYNMGDQDRKAKQRRQIVNNNSFNLGSLVIYRKFCKF